MLVPQLLFEKLQDLPNDDFETFKWYLSMKILDSCRPIPKSLLENKGRREIVSRMIDSYCEELAVKVTVEILRKMNVNNIADEIQSRFEEGRTPAPSSSSSASNLAAGTTISAQQGAFVIAPAISGGHTGAVNINIHHK